MRILVLSNLYPPVVRGGYEVECAEVTCELAKAHEVLVLTSEHLADTTPDDPRILRTLPWSQQTKADSLRAPLDALRGAREARRVLADFRPDLVFVWNAAGIPHSALRILEQADAALAVRVCEHWFGYLYKADVFTRHLYPGEKGLRGVWARAMRLVNRHPDLRIDVHAPVEASVSWVSAFLRGGVAVPQNYRLKLDEVRHSRTRQDALFATLQRAPDPDPLILFAGRIDVAKGVDVAIRALGELRARHGIHARLVLAGAGDTELARRVAGEAGVPGQVELPGWLDAAGLAAYASRAGVWVIPSVWHEPMGLVVQEAALARVPAVIARVGGMPELLREDVDALFFSRGDAGECAERLAAVLIDPAAAAARAASAFRRINADSSERYLADMVDFAQRAASAP